MVLKLLLLFLCVARGLTDSTVENKKGNDFELTIRMPNATSHGNDALVCHSMKLPERESYILRFEPHASMKVAHHMMVYGCGFPATDKAFWSCPLIEESESELSICGGSKRQIVFAWANDAPAKNLPEGVGFRVGGTTGINYLVLQLHYVEPFGVESADTSGVTLYMTYDRQPQQAGYYVLGNVGTIPPQHPKYIMESACPMDLNYTIYPIGYRTHGHKIAVVNSGYRLRGNEWTELGRMSPERPQTFYDVTNPGLDIREGDVLAARCTFNSMNRTQITQIGPTNADEMCNFYILYSTFEQRDLSIDYCFRGDTFAWDTYFDNIPSDASSLKGIPGADEIRHKFNMDPR